MSKEPIKYNNNDWVFNKTFLFKKAFLTFSPSLLYHLSFYFLTFLIFRYILISFFFISLNISIVILVKRLWIARILVLYKYFIIIIIKTNYHDSFSEANIRVINSQNLVLPEAFSSNQALSILAPEKRPHQSLLPQEYYFYKEVLYCILFMEHTLSPVLNKLFLVLTRRAPLHCFMCGTVMAAGRELNSHGHVLSSISKIYRPA